MAPASFYAIAQRILFITLAPPIALRFCPRMRHNGLALALIGRLLRGTRAPGRLRPLAFLHATL
jgi:hypothetical protein